MNIGFLEFQLTNSHYKKYHSLLVGAAGGGEVKVVAADELQSTDQGKQWCSANNIRYCETPQEVVAASDAIVVLAPNNPEKHLEVAMPAITSGKPVFIDKMLAHNPDNAKAILDVAAKAKTPVMCASGLRFALELEELDKKLKGAPEDVFARGYGKFPVYAIHTITLALRYFGSDVNRVIDTGTETAHTLTIDNGKMRASIEVRDSKSGKDTNPWQVGLLSGGRYDVATIKDSEGFYTNLMRQTVEFFKTGKSPISVEEQLAAVQVQWAAEQSLAQGGVWVDVGDAGSKASAP